MAVRVQRGGVAHGEGLVACKAIAEGEEVLRCVGSRPILSPPIRLSERRGSDERRRTSRCRRGALKAAH